MTLVSVVIPTIPTREELLKRALQSVYNQHRKVDHISVAVDNNHDGAAATRNRALRAALAGNPDGWIALLDDDDEILPHHVSQLIHEAEWSNVGVAWGWSEVRGGGDPLPPDFRGRVYDPDAPHCVPITYIARASLFQSALDEVGGFDVSQTNTGYWSQDEVVLSHMVRRGGHIAINDTTWWWHHHGHNTSGRADRW